MTKTNASSLYRKLRPSAPRPSTPPPGRSTMPDSGGGERDAYYDITQSLFPKEKFDRSSFGSRGRSEMNDRRPKPTNLPRWAGGAITNATPSIGTDDDASPSDRRVASTGTRRSKVTTTNATPSIPGDVDAPLLDITGTGRGATGMGAVRKGGTKPGSYEEGRKRYDESFRAGMDSDKGAGSARQVRVDVAKQFPASRPTLSVNTGTKKASTTSGSYDESERRPFGAKQEGVDITKRFPKSRPTMTVNTGTKKASTTTGSYEESTMRLGIARQNEGDGYVDVQNFPEDRTSFMKRVNSSTNDAGTKTRAATAVSQEEGYRDIARNFSRDQASLHGHPNRKRVIKRPATAEEECDDDDICLDINNFSSDLAPSSPKVAVSSNAVWRADSSAVKHRKYLDADPQDMEMPDTPRAFAKNLDMVPPSKARATEADKYLDTNQFSWNLSPSTGETAAARAGAAAAAAAADTQFLDTPRPFQASVNMRSSNMSGAAFKRSTDVPPELRNVRDYSDITTAPFQTGRTVESGSAAIPSSRRRGVGGGGPIDVTRAYMSTLARATSAVKDANSELKAKSKGRIPVDEASAQTSVVEDATGSSLGKEETTSSYEQVMHWLLTRLPQLQEDDAIAYFNCLLEDGFDSVAMLSEIGEEDLEFMKRGHRRALLRNIDTIKEEKTAADDVENTRHSLETETSNDDDDDDNDNDIELPQTSDDAIYRTKAQLDEAEAWIAEQNLLEEERLSARLEAEAERAGIAIAQNQKDVTAEEDDQFEDITRSSFVERSSSNSLSASRPENKRQARDGYEKEVYDMTRDAFAERPPRPHETPPMSERSEIESNDEPNTSVPRSSNVPVAAAPRAELYQYYVGEKGLAASQAQKLKDYYTTWADDSKSHQARFTCVFTCPLTGEHFASGSWGGSGEMDVEDQIFWYRNKKGAMNAAAAKALDCFSLREFHRTDNAPPAQRRCRDAPHTSEDDAPVLPIPPTGVDFPTVLFRQEDSSPD